MAFSYFRPPDLAAALVALAENSGALPIAGGTSLVPRLRRREIEPPLLVDVSRLAELCGIHQEADCLVVGSAVTLATIARSPEARSFAPVLAESCERTRSPQIRSAATIGGCLRSGPDFAEPTLALLALGARVVIRSERGQREESIENFIASADASLNGSPFGGGLGPTELITGILLPRVSDSTRLGAGRVTRREGIEPPLAAATVSLELAPDGTVESARIYIGVVTSSPARLASAEVALRGKNVLLESVSFEDLRLVTATAQAGVALRPDVRASESYRRRIIPVAVARSVEAALKGDR